MMRRLRGLLAVARAGRAGIRRRPGRALGVLAGILAAGLSFGLLTSESAVSRLQVDRTVRENFRSAYDILVRPRGAASRLESEHHLVDDGFLSGLFGGITMRQYREIARMPGVSLAAPVANVGYFIVSTQLFVPFPRRIRPTGGRVYRITLDWLVHHGLAVYPGATSYVYYTTGKLRYTGTDAGLQSVPGEGQKNVCGGFGMGAAAGLHHVGGRVVVVIGKAVTNPYAQSLTPQFYCASPRLSFASGVRTYASSTNAEIGGELGAEVTFEFPVMIAGIDPAAEERLVGLRGAVTSGRYLQEGEGLTGPHPTPGLTGGRPFTRSFPVLASVDTFLDQRALISVSQLRLASGPRLSHLLASSHAYADVTRARSGPTLWRHMVSPTRAWRSVLGNFRKSVRLDFSPAYWRVGPAHDALRLNGRQGFTVTPMPVANDPQVWSDTNRTSEFLNISFAPPGSNDTWYRKLTAFGASGNTLPHGPQTFLTPTPELVGTFDPQRLRGFSPLSRVPLQTFYPPQATGANSLTRHLLGNTALGPTTNLGGYLSQPPLLLTTLAGAIALENGDGDSYTTHIQGHAVHIQAYDGASPRAPISAIQIRVAGVTGPNALSLAKISLVAEEIARRTGLSVTVTAGSSPTNVDVKLAKGRYGTPPLDLRQAWVREDVDSAIIQAEDTKDLALLGLVAVACALFVAATTYAGVRARRQEMAILGTLGWPRAAIFQLIVGEVAQIAIVAGLAATGVTVGLGVIGSLHSPALALTLITPSCLMLGIGAAVIPTFMASRTVPLAGLRGEAMPVGRHRRVRSLPGLALAELARVPGRTLLGVATLALAVSATASLLGIEIAFRGDVAHDLLGRAVVVSVRSADIASVVLVALVGGACVADIVHSSMRERRAELASLRATGWTTEDLARLAALESLALGFAGSVLGAAIGSAVVTIFGASLGAVVATVVVGVITGTAVSTVAAILPMFLRSQPSLLDGLASGTG
jgi:putative ABC transport system permease protein